MADIPTTVEVRRQLGELADERYSPAARRRASAWATPILIAAGTPLVTDPPPLADALFLLGAADLLGDFENYVYGPSDFQRAAEELADGDGQGG